MKTRHLAFAVLAFSLCVPLSAAEQPSVKPIEKPVAKPVAVPFELLKSGHMAVMIKVNGKGPYRVIFDTGAPINLLNNKLAKEAGLLKDAPQSVLPFVGTIGEVKVKEMEVGTEKAANQPAIVMDHPLVELMAKKLGPLYGIVGYPFFARYRMTIDYQAETLTLVPNGYKPANVMRSIESTLFQLMAGGPQTPKVLSPTGQWGLVAAQAIRRRGCGRDRQRGVVRRRRGCGRPQGGRPAAVAGRTLDRYTGRPVRGGRFRQGGQHGGRAPDTRWKGNGRERQTSGGIVEELQPKSGRSGEPSRTTGAARLAAPTVSVLAL